MFDEAADPWVSEQGGTMDAEAIGPGTGGLEEIERGGSLQQSFGPVGGQPSRRAMSAVSSAPAATAREG